MGPISFMRYQFLVDFINNGAGKSPHNGDRFKIAICTEPVQTATGPNTVKCFQSLIAGGSTAYQLQTNSVTTNAPVTSVRPGGTVIGNGQRIADASLIQARLPPLSSLHER